jgi:hypothetical protein
MRRLSRFAVALVPVVLLALALLPTLAYAADDGTNSYAGTYMGRGDGKDKNGKTGDSMVTIWVEDLGDTARITFQVDKLDVTVDAEGPEQWSGEDQVTIPITINKYGVDATGEITFSRDGNTWLLGGSGSGKAYTYDGDGQTALTRISTGIPMPSLAEQIKDMGEAVVGGPPDPASDSDLPAKGQVETQAEQASSLAPADAAPPVPTDELFFGLSLLLFFPFILLFL